MTGDQRRPMHRRGFLNLSLGAGVAEAGEVTVIGERAAWEAAAREDARAGRPFRSRLVAGQHQEAYSRAFWGEFDRLRFERGEYDLL